MILFSRTCGCETRSSYNVWNIQKNKRVDAEGYAKAIFKRSSKLNVRDEMAAIITHTVRNRGYDRFIEGAIFINDKYHVGWANLGTNELVILGDVGDIISLVDLRDALKNDQCALYENEISAIGNDGDSDREVSEYFVKMFCNGVCDIFEKQSEKFRNLPKM